MTELQVQIKDVCRLADAVIKDPTSDIAITATNIGVCAAVAGFAAGGNIILAPMLGPVGWVIAAGTWIAKKLGKKEKERQEKERQRQEKERMLREVICKQQAVINKLNKELAKDREQNAQNRQEIENLKNILKMLTEIEEHLNAT